jgi:hypothetical protein
MKNDADKRINQLSTAKLFSGTIAPKRMKNDKDKRIHSTAKVVL